MQNLQLLKMHLKELKMDEEQEETFRHRTVFKWRPDHALALQAQYRMMYKGRLALKTMIFYGEEVEELYDILKARLEPQSSEDK